MSLLARLALALLVLVSTSSPARPALAQGESPRNVEVVLVGQLAMDPVFAARVTSWFAGERLHVTVRKARWLEPRQVLAPTGDAAVHVWVTLNGNALARLYFASEHGPSGSPSYFLRELRLDNGLDEIGAEHVAEVLNLSTLALLEGQAQSAREELEQTLRAEPAAAPGPPASAAPARAAEKPVPLSAARRPSAADVGAGAGDRAPRRRWSARVGYAASYRADEGTWHGPCAAFELALWRKLGLRAEALGALPAERELTPLELRFYGVAFAVAPSVRHALAAGIDLQWFVGPGLEVVRYAPVRPVSSEYQAGEAATEARPALTAGVGALWGRGPVLAVVAQATLPLTKTHYDVVRAQAREVIGRASPIVPTLGVEVGF
jgi:hypothetical protein